MNSFRLVTVPDPAAGNDFFYTQPPNLFSKVRLCRFRFTASAFVITRYMNLGFGLPSLLAMNPWTQGCASGIVRTYICVDEYSQAESVLTLGADSVVLCAAGGFWLYPGAIIYSGVRNIQAADQISDIRLLVEDLNVFSPGVVG